MPERLAALDPRFAAIFKKGSKTYFNSSLFFPEAVRRDVYILYAFVRTADNFVDAVPQDGPGFLAFRKAWEDAEAADTQTGDLVIDSFIDLSRRKNFDPAWTQAFLDSMQADLTKRRYDSLEETLQYIYGSAEVIGLFMAAIMGLEATAREAAKALGRSMQYINFIRDIDEDNALGRTYLPLAGSGLPDLRRETAIKQPAEFCAFIREQAKLYLGWQREAEAGFAAMPWRARIPVATASRMYNWTARVIYRDPFVVFKRKVKPGRWRILASVLANSLAVLFGRL